MGGDRDFTQRRVHLLCRPLDDSKIRQFGEDVGDDDNKTATMIDGKQVLSIRNLMEYDCKGSRRRMLAATAYAGHLGKGTVIGSENFRHPIPGTPWCQ